MKHDIVYLDNAATTEVKQNVIEVMKPYLLGEKWHNPSALYPPAKVIREDIDKARKDIADCIGCFPEEIYFTSGGSEANNMAIKGFYMSNKHSYVVTSSVEHSSIMRMAGVLSSYRLKFATVDENGMLNTEELIGYLDESMRLYELANISPRIIVSVQYANNETGVIQNIDEIANICDRYNAVFHTDAVQAFPHIDIDMNKLNVDMMSVSGHKFGGPKGSGFLYIRKGTPIKGFISGSQEGTMRGGTENAAAIVGLAEAVKTRYIDNGKIERARNFLEREMVRQFCTINGKKSKRVCNISSVTFDEDISYAEMLLHLMAKKGYYFSTRSACEAEMPKSHVLTAMGLDKDHCDRTMRLSLSEETTRDDIIAFSKDLEKVIDRLLRKYGVMV